MPGGSGIAVKLERSLICGVLPPWGFRIHGGKDFSHNLTVLRVTPGSIADRCGLWNGDVIEQINGKDATHLLHLDAQQLIKISGEKLDLVVERAEANSTAVVANGTAASTATNTESPKPEINGSSYPNIDTKTSDGESVSSVNLTTPVTQTENGDKTDDTQDIKIVDSDSPQSVDAADVEVEIAVSKTQARSPSPADEPPPLPRSHVPDFYVRPVPVEATIPSWMDPRPEPAMGRTMKLLQKKLATGETPGSTLESSEHQTPDPPSAEKPEKKSDEPKPFVSSTLQLLQEEEEEKQRLGNAKPKPRNAPSNSVESAGDPPLGRTMRMLQQQLKIGGDNPLPSVLAPDYSKTHARPRSWGQQGRPSTIIKAPTPRNLVNTAPEPVISKPPEPVKAPEPAKPDPVKPNVGPNYRYYAGLNATPDKEIEPVQVGRRRSEDFEKKRASIDTSGAVGASKVFDTWTGVWKDPEPARLGTYQHTDKIKPPPPKPKEGVLPAKKADVPDGVVKGEPSKPSCASCHQTIKGTFVSAVGKNWCPDHFCCDYCKINLSDGHFVEEEGKIYCQEDHELLFSPRCATCNETISGHAIKAIGKSYHPEHFVCAKCKKPFEGDGFMLEQGQPYCQKDYDDLFAVICCKCKNSITGGERYIEALGKEWHTSCFACSVCKTELEGTKFFVVNGAPYCQDHKGMMKR